MKKDISEVHYKEVTIRSNKFSNCLPWGRKKNKVMKLRL